MRKCQTVNGKSFVGRLAGQGVQYAISRKKPRRGCSREGIFGSGREQSVGTRSVYISQKRSRNHYRHATEPLPPVCPLCHGMTSMRSW